MESCFSALGYIYPETLLKKEIHCIQGFKNNYSIEHLWAAAFVIMFYENGVISLITLTKTSPEIWTFKKRYT